MRGKAVIRVQTRSMIFTSVTVFIAGTHMHSSTSAIRACSAQLPTKCTCAPTHNDIPHVANLEVYQLVGHVSKYRSWNHTVEDMDTWSCSVPAKTVYASTCGGH